MKKNLSLYDFPLMVVLLVSLGITGCRKDKQDTNETPEIEVPTNRVKTILAESSLRELNYDSKNRISENRHNGKLVLSYTYQGKEMIEKAYTDSGTVRSTAIYQLAGGGIVISMKNPDYPNILTTYEYNDKKQMIKDKRRDAAGSTDQFEYYYNSAGNKDSMRYTRDNNWVVSIKYEYYTDKPATLEYPNTGYVFLGKQNTNPVKKETGLYASGTSFEKSYIYDYDAQNRIIRKRTVQGVDTFGHTMYTYY